MKPRSSLDSLAAIYRMFIAIVTTSQKDKDKIEALRLAKETELDRVTLLGEGPTALAIRKRARKELDDPKTDLQSTT